MVCRVTRPADGPVSPILLPLSFQSCPHLLTFPPTSADSDPNSATAPTLNVFYFHPRSHDCPHPNLYNSDSSKSLLSLVWHFCRPAVASASSHSTCLKPDSWPPSHPLPPRMVPPYLVSIVVNGIIISQHLTHPPNLVFQTRTLRSIWTSAVQ